MFRGKVPKISWMFTARINSKSNSKSSYRAVGIPFKEFSFGVVMLYSLMVTGVTRKNWHAKTERVNSLWRRGQKVAEIQASRSGKKKKTLECFESSDSLTCFWLRLRTLEMVNERSSVSFQSTPMLTFDFVNDTLGRYKRGTYSKQGVRLGQCAPLCKSRRVPSCTEQLAPLRNKHPVCP